MIRPRCLAIQTRHFIHKRLQQNLNISTHRVEIILCNIPSTAMPFRQRNHARRQRNPGLHLTAIRFARHPHHLGGAAANIEDDGRYRILANERLSPRRRQHGLGFPVDDFQFQPDFRRNPVNKIRAILSEATGLGSDEPEALHLVPFQLVGADPQRFNGPVHRYILQAARGAQALTQPHDAGEGINDDKAPLCWPRQKQAAIVGAKVQRTITGGMGQWYTALGLVTTRLSPAAGYPHESRFAVAASGVSRPDAARVHCNPLRQSACTWVEKPQHSKTTTNMSLNDTLAPSRLA